MQPELPLSVLEFTFRAVDPITIPTHTGALWHGVFGRALYRQSCIAPETECKRCLLLHRCDYPYLFHRIAPPNSEILRGKEIPVPHIFRTADAAGMMIDGGEVFKLGLVIIGTANNKFYSIVRAMRDAGAGGLGRQRGQARLLSVQQITPGDHEILLIDEERILAEPRPERPETPDLPQRANLDFITPYKPTGKRTTAELDLSRLLMAIVRRVSLLQYFYTGKRLNADFTQLKNRAKRAQLKGRSLHRQPGRHYSASHGKYIDTSGWLGTLELDNNYMSELWPYIWLGQWLHVGKNASMGFGRYRLT